MKQYIYISLLLLAGCLCACQEEDLNLADLENVFLPSPNATDESSELRRNFYEATGCYLLFNDTLRHEYGGVDAYGNPYYDTELLSLGWNYISGSSNPTRYVYEYIETIEQQRKAAEWLQDYLMPYLGNVVPYSLLVVNRIDHYVVDGNQYEYDSSPISASDFRCMALNISGLWDTDDLQAYAQEFCYEFIFSSWGNDPFDSDYEENAYEFYRCSRWDYEEDKEDYMIPDGIGDEYDAQYITRFYRYGFLVNTNETLMPDYKSDVISYIKACLTMTDEEFRAKYGEYEAVMEKYEYVKPLVEQSGIKF